MRQGSAHWFSCAPEGVWTGRGVADPGQLLVEVAQNLGTASHLIDSCKDIQPEWLENVNTIALTAGASAPECLVEEVVEFLRTKGYNNVREVEVMPENVRFGLPPEIVEAIAAAPRPAGVSAD